MHFLEVVLILAAAGAGAFSAGKIAWENRLKHVWPKRDQIKIVNPSGLWTGIAEVVFQTKVIANRPVAGIFHLLIFYGFVIFGAKSVTHFLNGLLGLETPIGLGPLDYVIDVFSVLVLTGVVFMAIRRFSTMRDRLTHMLESGIVLLLIATLMITYQIERPTFGIGLEHLQSSVPAKINWWVHFLVLCGFPSLIAFGKHFHLVVGPVNVVLKHMTEVPSDRPVSGNDLDMGDDDSPEEFMDQELARVAMPNGVSDFSFHTLFDPAACIECGRCNDACPSAAAGLKPREHFVLAFRNPATNADELQELAPPDIVATCTQCRACDTVCPVGNRPSMAGLELRGRLTAEGVYPPRALKKGGNDPVESSGNIFGLDPDERERFITENNLPIFDADEHDMLFVLGCQGGYSPEVQPVVVATARLLEAAGIKYGVLPEESCWGEAVLHGGGLMENWPIYKSMQAEVLGEMLGGDHNKLILTICPHCKDSIHTQYAHMGNAFTNVRSHISYFHQLLKEGRLKVTPKAATMAVHHPCKTIHNDEQGDLDALLELAGIKGETAGDSPDIPRCCGGGGGGFLWDSPAKVNKSRFEQIMAETQLKEVATGCPGCHRMLNAARTEDAKIVDVATLLHDRLTVEGEAK